MHDFALLIADSVTLPPCPTHEDVVMRSAPPLTPLVQLKPDGRSLLVPQPVRLFREAALRKDGSLASGRLIVAPSRLKLRLKLRWERGQGWGRGVTELRSAETWVVVALKLPLHVALLPPPLSCCHRIQRLCRVASSRPTSYFLPSMDLGFFRNVPDQTLTNTKGLLASSVSLPLLPYLPPHS